MKFTYYRYDWCKPVKDGPVVTYYEVAQTGEIGRVIDLFQNDKIVCYVRDTYGVDCAGKDVPYELAPSHKLSLPPLTDVFDWEKSEVPYSLFRGIWCDKCGY